MADENDPAQTMAALLEEEAGLASPRDRGWFREPSTEVSLEQVRRHLRGQREAEDPTLEALLEEATNGQTFLFRDLEQLEAVVSIARRISRARAGPVSIWCAGCSTGEEPYSLAILCREMGVPVRILGTDLSTVRLHAARTRLYSTWSARRVPQGILRRHLRPRGDRLEIRADVASSVRFARHNLVGEVAPEPEGGRGWDIILCRNVLIHLSDRHADEVVARLADALAPDGRLLLGAAEQRRTIHAPLTRVRVGPRFAFQRIEARPSTSTPPAAWPRPARASPPTPPSPPIQEADGWLDWVECGNRQLARHELGAARAAYERAAELAPMEPEVQVLAGITAVKADDDPLARVHLRRALFLAPDHWLPPLLLAGVDERQGHLRQARAALRLARDRLQGEGPVLFRSDVSGIAAASVDAAEALDICERRLALHE